MTLIVDAAPLVAAADEREPLRDAVRDVLRSEPQTNVVPAPVTATQPTGGRSRPREIRATSQDTPTIPTGLPTT